MNQITKAAAHYRLGTRERKCGNCKWMDVTGTCDMVQGTVTAPMMCDKYQKEPSEPR